MNKKVAIHKIFLTFLTGFFAVFCVDFSFSQNTLIRLEIFCDGQLQPTAAHEWARELNSLRFQSVQIRAGDSTDVLDIQPIGDRMYHVSGMLTRGNRILLPGDASFSLGQVRSIKPYLEELISALESDLAATQAAEEAERSGASAQSETAQDTLFTDLAEPVNFSTQGISRRKVLQKLSRQFDSRVQFPKSIQTAFDEEDLVTEELNGIARGTALVYVLRYLGFCVVPVRAETSETSERARAGAGTGTSDTSETGWILRVVAADRVNAADILPVGYPAEKATPDVLFERFQANVDGATAETVLNSLQKRLDIPFLYDYNSMAGRGIELNAVTVKQRAGKFSYKQLLDAVLYQAQLQREVRTDEAGRVFFWISTIRSGLE
ncbi:MAG: hypothetical protein Q4C70_13740 [Planctomycetia bacterium]|nr:hypothetical protein [Planctomycetia bacterium]